MSELEFLGALEIELVRHRELHPQHSDHELFQTSTVQALLEGAFDGDVTLGEVLEHGDLGLGTLEGLDGELIVLDGQVWKAHSMGRSPGQTCHPERPMRWWCSLRRVRLSYFEGRSARPSSNTNLDAT